MSCSRTLGIRISFVLFAFWNQIKSGSEFLLGRASKKSYQFQFVPFSYPSLPARPRPTLHVCRGLQAPLLPLPRGAVSPAGPSPRPSLLSTYRTELLLSLLASCLSQVSMGAGPQSLPLLAPSNPGKIHPHRRQGLHLKTKKPKLPFLWNGGKTVV